MSQDDIQELLRQHTVGLVWINGRTRDARARVAIDEAIERLRVAIEQIEMSDTPPDPMERTYAEETPNTYSSRIGL